MNPNEKCPDYGCRVGLEEMFIEVGQQVLPDGNIPPPTKAEIEKMLAIAPKYGVEIRVPMH
jgi:hypothetical protein